MALLTHPRWDTVTETMHNLLSWIGKQGFASHYYLAGGTGLALQLGHRRSVDLDFFSETDLLLEITRQRLIDEFNQRQGQVVENSDGNLLLLVEGLHVGFFSYGYPLLDPLLELEHIGIASLLDLGLMKLDAIIGRGSRKDFYDLYFISQKIPLKDLLGAGQRKYPQVRDFPLMAMEGLALFDNADRDLQPELLVDISWESVMQYFLRQVRSMGNEWMGD
jgi:hypothetical protein